MISSDIILTTLRPNICYNILFILALYLQTGASLMMVT